MSSKMNDVEAFSRALNRNAVCAYEEILLVHPLLSSKPMVAHVGKFYYKDLGREIGSGSLGVRKSPHP